LDRTLLIELSRLDKKERKTMTKLLKSFEIDAPYILGQILDVLVRVVARRHEEFDEYGRLADWDGVSNIVAEELDIKDAFIRARNKSESEQHVEIVESHLETRILLEFMEGKDIWDSTKGEFYDKLTEMVVERGEGRYWPKSSPAFFKKLKVYSHNLKEMGIKITHDKNQNTRTVLIEKVNPTSFPDQEDSIFSGSKKDAGLAVLAVPAVIDNHIIGLRSTPTGLYLVRGGVQNEKNNEGPVSHREAKPSSLPPVGNPMPPYPKEVQGWSQEMKEIFQQHSDWQMERGLTRAEADRAAVISVERTPHLRALLKRMEKVQESC
jgi:hypothetical protein